MNIILCGLQSSGKTVVGQQLASQLHCSFLDTDLLIESAFASQTTQQLTCRQIYRQKGEVYFRALEQKVVCDLSISHTVIATGGGSLENPKCLEHLKQLGILVYLKVPLEILWQRSVCKGIPAYLDVYDPKAHFDNLAQRRIPLYEEAAEMIIETEDLGVEQIAAKIHEGLQGVALHEPLSWRYKSLSPSDRPL